MDSNHKLSKNYLKKIMQLDYCLPQDVMDLFILSCQSKLIHRVKILAFVTSENTVISSFDLYRVCEQYWGACFGSTRLNHAISGAYESFHDWKVPQSVLDMIKGENGSSTSQNWMSATQNMPWTLGSRATRPVILWFG
ncbi:uncharacterized protein LOC130988905 isoform X2 [Salvia miltiorrhiza]|uniref:uncharacterized protein LOC130988905 isoform X2 n=1 Tax=Salvia miltiorrhiza TaxID=226208 RepID=UPI0025ACA444|nr:uncharacterized protein LOC130988905 isoform X2 [Salvia miltiorrhiza]